MKLFEYWRKLSYSTATSNSWFRLICLPFASGVFLFSLAVVIGTSLWLDSYLNLPGFLSYPWSLILIIPFFSSGILLILWTSALFFKAKGMPIWSNPPPRLIIEGPYGFVRNPMMCGFFFALFGLGAFLDSISLFFIFNPLFILFYYTYIKNVEEPDLVKRLGEDYVEYRKRVPMIFPRFGNTRKITFKPEFKEGFSEKPVAAALEQIRKENSDIIKD